MRLFSSPTDAPPTLDETGLGPEWSDAGIISMTCGLTEDPFWPPLVVENMRATLERFAETSTDPTILNRTSGPLGTSAEFLSSR